MLDVSRVKQLKSLAQDMASKNGHQLGPWEITHIVYGGGKRRVKRVEAHKTACKLCKGDVQVAVGLVDQIAGDILEDYCPANTGMREIIVPLHDDSGCGSVLAYSRDLGTTYMRECA